MEVETAGLIVGINVVEIVVVIGFRVERILLVVKIDEGSVEVNVSTIVVGAFVAWIVDENVPADAIVKLLIRI